MSSERYIQFKTRDNAVIEKARRAALTGSTEVFEVSPGEFHEIRVQNATITNHVDGWHEVTVAGVHVKLGPGRDEFIRRYVPIRFERDFSDEGQWDALDRANAIRRPKDMVYVTSDRWEYEEAKRAVLDCRATTLGGTYGFVVNVGPWNDGGPTSSMKAHGRITIRPTHDPHAESLKVLGIRRLGDISFSIHFLKEQNMKVFEAIVIETDDKGEPSKVLKVVAPFVAKDSAAANSIVRVDYAQEHSLAGKEASALVVRVREFSGV